MIGIEAIASYIPAARVDNLARAAAAGKDAEFIREKIGFVSLARKAPGEETSDLCVKAFARLVEKTGLAPAAIDCLVVCTQNPDAAGLPHTSAIVHGKLGLGRAVAAFDLSLGCSGYVYSLSVVEAFMQRHGFKCGVIFTADPYSKVLDPSDYDTELLFGDAATVTLISERPVFRSLNSVFSSNGAMGHSIAVQADSGTLRMLGSNVFKFSMTEVPAQVRQCLEKNAMNLADIDLFLFHQGSKFMVENLAQRLGIDPARAPFLAAEIGNTVSSTIPLMLEQYLASAARNILICGFGVGLSWGSSVLQRV